MSHHDSNPGIGSLVHGAILSRSGAAIFIGALGFLSGITGLFIDPNSQVSIKWLLLSALVSITIVVVLLNLIAAKPSTVELPIPFDEVPISLRGDSLLVVKRNPYLSNLIVVAGYTRDAEFEELAFIGTVAHIQDKAVQVQIELVYNGFVPAMHYRDVVVRPVVPKQFIVELLAAAQPRAAAFEEPPPAEPAPGVAPIPPATENP